jgi:hypothetical protein
MVIRSIHGELGMVFIGFDTDGECLWGTPEEKLNMGIPIDSDWNDLPAKIESEMTDAGKHTIAPNGSVSPEPNLGPVVGSRPKEARGGTFAPADIKVIKQALDHYLRLDLSNAEVNHIANLLHRLNRI